MLSLTSGIPLSDANPLLDFIDQGPEMAEQHRRDMEDWRARQTDTLDRAALDPDAFYADKAIDIPGIDPAHLRRATTVRSYLTLANDGKPVTGDLYPELFRQRIARERFNGRGAESDDAFFTEIQKEAQGRADSRALAADIQSAATTGALLRETSAAALDSQSFQLWREEAKKKPGYQPGLDFAYLDAWNETQAAIKENLEPYIGPLKKVFQSMQSGGADWYDAYEQVPEANREAFMASLALLVRAQPAEQQPGLWEKIVKTNSRVWQTAAVDIMDFTGSNLDAYAANNIGTPGQTPEQQLAAQADTAETRKRRNFIDDINAIRSEDYDPVKALGFGEKVALGIVSTVPYMASAAVPTVGTGLVYAQTERMLARDFRRDLMKGKDGIAMSDDDATAMADTLAPYVAAPYAAIERLQVLGLAGKLPLLEKALAATANRLQNQVLRFAGRTVGAAFAETLQENLQQALPAVSQELAAALNKEVPGTVWKNGRDGFFDGYWENTAVTFATMLPLSIVAGAGGIQADQRARIFASTPDLHLRVLGIPADGVARIREAQAAGNFQAEAQIATELGNLDPRSEDAKDATQELAENLQAQKEALAAAQRTGVMPTFYRSADGWSVRDGESGAEIGTSTTADGALRLAMAHTSAIEEDNADQIAALATLLEAGDVVAATDQEGVRQTATDLRPGQVVTTSQQAAMSEMDDTRIRQQIEARERLGGSDGGTARMVLGQSVTETRQKVRNTVNRINAGGSVLTVFHEETHGFFREALATGRLTRDETVAAIRAIETVLAGKVTKDGQQLRFLPDGEVTDLQLDEAVSELMEAEILRTRKTAGRSGTAARSLPPGLVTRNLTAMARLAPGAAAKLRDFIAAVRAFWGLTFQRAAAIKSAIREGKLDETELDAFKSKLFGLEDQTDLEQAARDTEARILDGAETAAELDGDPFSLGRTDRPIFSSTNVSDLRHDKTAWIASGASPAGAVEIVEKFYKPAAFASIPRDAVLVAMPTTSGKNTLPLFLADRISKDFGNKIEFRPAGIAVAKGEAKNKRTFFDKEADPVGFMPEPEVLADLQGVPVFITEDVHNTGESWIAFARMLIENGVNVQGVAALVSTEQRLTSPRDIDRLSEKVAAHLGKGIDEVRPAMHSLFDGSFKQLFNKAEADVTRSAEKAGRLFEIAASGRRAGAYRNPLRAGESSSGGSSTLFEGEGLEQGTFSFSIGRATVTPTADSRLFEGAEGSPTVLGPAAFSIRAHHGTPHKVDKFTTGKIGTGEGAQAYGWGLYFAEAEEVASSYRKAGRSLGIIKDGDGQWWTTDGPKTIAGPFATSREAEAVAEAPAGNLYTVTLKVEDDQLLDWDMPLSEQSELVQAALRRGYELQGLDYPETAATPKTGQYIYKDMVAAAGGLETLDSAKASEFLTEIGIRGIRFLDGNSRGKAAASIFQQDGRWNVIYNDPANGLAIRTDTFDTEAEAKALVDGLPGSYNYVIFDEADIEILEENGQPVAPSMSLGPAALADLLGKDAVSRIKDPVRRAQAMSRIAREMEAARLQFERLELVAGSKRLKKSLSREASIREALRREELENEAWSRHWQILSDDDLVKIKSQPAHRLLSDPTNPLRGRIQSRTETIRKNPDLYTFTEPAEYNGSETVTRTLFGGTLTPDLAVEELVHEGLLPPGSKPDAMWSLLNAEALSVSNRKRDLEIARQELREARTQAKDETNVWLREQGVTQETTFGDKQEILRALGVLDGILSSVPAEIRGKIGGYTQLARIATNEAKLSFLKDRLAKVDVELEKYLRDQFDREFRALLDRAKPEKDEAGKKPRGKIGADVHELFAAVREAMTMTGAEVEAEAVALESLVASGDYTAAQESHMTLQANLIRLAGDWGKADAARREAALVEATSIYAAGYMAHKTQTLQKREKRQKIRDILQAATGMAGTREERRGKQRKDETTKAGRALTTLFSLMSFEQVVQRAFGEDTQEARDLVDWERHAAHAKADAVQNKVDQLDDLFTSLAGGKLKGEELRFAMSRPDAITVDGQTFSELEAITATLMWRQEDGKRHMTGHVDDQGAPAGDWNYTQAFIDQLESKLSTNAKAVRLHLAQQYAAEYDRLNAVFRDLNGVSLPRHKQYSPLTVKPVQASGGQMLDPVTGMAMSGTGMNFGSLLTRSHTAIAEPDFKDALQVYIGHAKQMEHWIAYAPFATEAMAILNTRDLGNSVEAAAGKEALAVLRSWLDVFAQGGTRDAAAHLGLNKLLGRITGRAAATALVGRVSVLAIQSTQLAAGLAEMPTPAYISRLARLFAGRLDWSGALASDYIQRRRAQMPPIVQQAMEGLTSSKPSRLKYAVRKMGETIAGADALFTAGTFAIVYDYQLQQAQTLGLTGAAAKAYALEAAERSTDRVAQPVRPGTRSLYEVTAVNPLARISWSFASDARQKLALSAYALANKPPAAKARALAVTWIAGGVVATFIRAAMRDIRDDGEDDEIFDAKNWDPKRLALSALTGPLAGVPALGDAAEAMVFSLFGEYLPEGNLISGFSNAGRSGEKIPDGLTGDREGVDNAIKDTEAILSGFGLLSDSAAAVTSLLHVARDLFGIVQNVAD